MKYRSFVKTMWIFGLFGALGLGCGAVKLIGSCNSSSAATTTQAAPQPAPPPVQPPQPVQTVPVTIQGAAPPTTQDMRSKIEAWLTANPDRQGRFKQDDILPKEPYKATAVRFKEEDAVKFSNDGRQWSQIRIDLNRDGYADEKWLLKNGHTYKRETLDGNGKVVATQYFDK